LHEALFAFSFLFFKGTKEFVSSNPCISAHFLAASD
jgi:hypothetical protein